MNFHFLSDGKIYLCNFKENNNFCEGVIWLMVASYHLLLYFHFTKCVGGERRVVIIWCDFIQALREHHHMQQSAADERMRSQYIQQEAQKHRVRESTQSMGESLSTALMCIAQEFKTLY